MAWAARISDGFRGSIICVSDFLPSSFSIRILKFICGADKRIPVSMSCTIPLMDLMIITVNDITENGNCYIDWALSLGCTTHGNACAIYYSSWAVGLEGIDHGDQNAIHKSLSYYSLQR